jgi:hypothetical protein
MRAASKIGTKTTIFKEVQRELERHFLMMRLLMQQDNMITFALVAKSMFDIDPMVGKIKSMRGLEGIEVIIPSKITIYQDWTIKGIDRLINSYEKERLNSLIPS